VRTPTIGDVGHRWIERLFDEHTAMTRFIALSVLALGYLRLLNRPESAGGWVLALGALAVCLAGRKAPTVASVTLAAFIVVGDWMHANVSISLKAMMTIVLLELALYARGRRLGIAITAVVVFMSVHAIHALSGDIWPTLYRLAILVGLPLLFGGYIRLMRERARERAAEQELRRRSELLAERTAIARELHDLVAHHVSSMVLRVGVARHVLAPTADPGVAEVLDDLHRSGTTALADLRRLVSVLRDPALLREGPATSLVEPTGLWEALEATVERSRQTGLIMETDVDPEVTGLDTARGFTILRLTQEGLTNVAKHAGTTARVRLRLEMHDDRVRLEIVDDGGSRNGTRPGGRQNPRAESAMSSGHGIVGMAERVALLGGRLEAGPTPGGYGWRLFAELPPDPEPPAMADLPAAEAEPSYAPEPAPKGAPPRAVATSAAAEPSATAERPPAPVKPPPVPSREVPA
jgi:signal transduction histidine kinase